MTVQMSSTAAEAQAPEGAHLRALCVAALGIVYGDIGTSPLYAVRECFIGESVEVTRANVFGVLSLIFWSLVLVISVKYLTYVMRAHNRNEGGILSLMTLAISGGLPQYRLGRGLMLLGLFGAALLYGDGMITPAISVLSAVEGLEIAAPGLSHFVAPVTILILILLFLLQRRGTAGVGALFGPITVVWFVVLALLGVYQIAHGPAILLSLSPHYAVEFFFHERMHGVLTLGAVFLVVTGGEALYADMGHFGIKPIRLTWFAMVFPALLLNYLGQGALLLRDAAAASNPFYRMAPGFALYPLLVLATCATVIASQAVISGAFSLTRQATMLGFWPRLEVRHTSSREIGQIYVPLVNWTLMICTIGLVLGFHSSSALAAAYGVAVTTTMVITTLLAAVVAHRLWHWKPMTTIAVTVGYLVIDLVFFGANMTKFASGGWFPITVAAAAFLLMTTWKRGRELLAAQVRLQNVPLEDFFEVMHIERPVRIPSTAVFMSTSTQGTPPALLQNFKHNGIVHQRVVLLTVVTDEVAHIPDQERVTLEPLGEGFWRVTAHYGFMETPDVPALLARKEFPDTPLADTTFFLGRETLLADGSGMARWRGRLFAFMSRNSQRAPAFFGIPSDRVMEVGAQLEM